MYRRFLNNNDYLGVITREALTQLTRGIYKAMKLILEHEHIDLLIKPVSRKYS